MLTTSMEFTTERAAYLAMVDMWQMGFKTYGKPRKRNGFWVFIYQNGEAKNFEGIQRMKTDESPKWRGARQDPYLLGALKGDWEHGTWSGYCAHHCRCEDCVTAARKYSQDRYRKKKGKN